MRKTISYLLILFILVGCVPSPVTITTIPIGAKVFVDNELVGRSPVSFAKDRVFGGGGTLNVRIEMEGFKSITKTYKREWDSGFATLGCGMSLVFIFPLVFHLPYAYKFKEKMYFELEPIKK